MSNSPLDLDLSELNLDPQTLKAIAQLLDYTESFINPSQQPEAIASLYDLKNQITQLKSQKGKASSQKIVPNYKQLKYAFNANRDASEKISGTSSYLLLFYAAECGLKSVWLKRNQRNQRRYKTQDNSVLFKYGHSLDRWVKALKISTGAVGEPPDFHLEGDRSTILDIGKAHQVWRYGIKIEAKDEQKLVEWLQNICNWIKENINR
ncbi:MAG: hypothetical protein SXA11_06200 [Cyanobacteriota bacterium]|nr:hypothetical protein [Cyanobacteriota bacterium]